MAGDANNEYHDLHEIGEKIVEMADRLKVVALACPGAKATWGLDIDGTLFQITVTMKDCSKS